MRGDASSRRSSPAIRSAHKLEWLRAKAFAAATGGVSERRSTVDASEDLARRGQDVREMTRDLDLIKIEVDIVAMIARLRGASVAADVKAEEAPESEDSSDRAAI